MKLFAPGDVRIRCPRNPLESSRTSGKCQQNAVEFQGQSVFVVGGDSCRRFAAFCRLATNRRQETPPTVRIFNN
jgi:hypothetical protein